MCSGICEKLTLSQNADKRPVFPLFKAEEVLSWDILLMRQGRGGFHENANQYPRYPFDVY